MSLKIIKTSDNACKECPDGTFSAVHDNSPSCQEKTMACPSGQIITIHNNTQDNICELCPLNTTSPGGDSTECTLQKSCNEDEYLFKSAQQFEADECRPKRDKCPRNHYLQITPDSAEDNSCIKCIANTFSDGFNSDTSCLSNVTAEATCPEGTYETQDAAICRTCSELVYENGFTEERCWLLKETYSRNMICDNVVAYQKIKEEYNCRNCGCMI